MAKHKIFTIGRTIALLGAILLAVSAFLPWGKSATMSAAGADGDGIIQISIGILAFILLFIKRVSIWFSLFLGIMASIVGAIDFLTMYKALPQHVGGEMGIGLYTTLCASAAILLGTLVEIFQERSKKLRKNLAYLDDE